jgi:SAM-dependent methyltransferase
MNEVELKAELAQAYALRFGAAGLYRQQVWRVLISDFFQPLVGSGQTVLDLGCGWGEFINQIEATRKIGMDLNPETRRHLAPGVEFLEQNCAATWNLPDGALDVVFTSNFLEHLHTKEELGRTLAQARRCLKPGGRMICLGPNIKFLAGRYWDFLDHYLPLTESSLGEGLRLHGFAVERSVARFLPFTMSRQRPRPLWLVRAYLRLPWLWWVVGRQFLVIGRVTE